MAKSKKTEDAEIIKDDIFAQALEQSMTQNINIKTLVVGEDNTKQKSLPEIQRQVVKTWKELKVAIDNEHAERFNNILVHLPDREFVRIYLKTLEFVKPKIIRQSGVQAVPTDTTINIQINYGNKNR
jgi:hypothetical protein